jgi:hypothetical protein
MMHLWMLLLIGVILVVILGAVLQRLGRMVGGCFCLVFVVASVIVGTYMLFTGTAFCDVPIVGKSVCQLVEGGCGTAC